MEGKREESGSKKGNGAASGIHVSAGPASGDATSPRSRGKRACILALAALNDLFTYSDSPQQECGWHKLEWLRQFRRDRTRKVDCCGIEGERYGVTGPRDRSP